MRGLLLAFFLLTAFSALAEPVAPNTIVIIACRVDDLTGQDGRQDPNLAARGWRDLEWAINPKSLELECKREVVPLEDSVSLKDPSIPPLASNFSDFAQCASVAMSYSPTYEQAHVGWAVMAVGCPVRIETDGHLTGFKLQTALARSTGCRSSVGLMARSYNRFAAVRGMLNGEWFVLDMQGDPKVICVCDGFKGPLNAEYVCSALEHYHQSLFDKLGIKSCSGEDG